MRYINSLLQFETILYLHKEAVAKVIQKETEYSVSARFKRQFERGCWINDRRECPALRSQQ